LNYQQLLTPISAEMPTGIYLKSDRSVYRALRNNFNAAQSSFRRLIETPESANDEALFIANQENWQLLSESCWQTLTENSKDIEIYAWWMMSLFFQPTAIAKVAESLAILPQFIAEFWPDIQPFLPEEKLKTTEPTQQLSERAELQLKPLIQLLGESTNSGLLCMPLQMMSLVGDIDHSHYLSATKDGHLPTLKTQAKKDFSVNKDTITQTIIALDVAIKGVVELDVWLKSTMQQLSLPVISCQFLHENLTSNLQAIQFLVADCYGQWPLDQTGEKIEPELSTEAAPIEKPSIATTNEITKLQHSPLTSQPVAAINVNQQIMNRDIAFQQLKQIAQYFAQAEPHSPVAPLLEKAIRWGYMSLDELMKELLAGNDSVLKQVSLVTGMGDDKTNVTEIDLVTNHVNQEDNNQAVQVEIKQSKEEVLEPAKPAEQEKEETKNTSSDAGFSW